MAYNPETHHRRSIRLAKQDYSQAGAYYITLATHEKEYLFGEITAGVMHLSDMGRIADEHWRAIPHHFSNVALGAYIVMPNHVHGIIVIRPPVGASMVGASQWDAREIITTLVPTDAQLDIPSGASQWDAPTNTPTLKGPKRGSIGAIIGAYKMSVTQRIQCELGCSGIWQRNYFEHIIRSEKDYLRIHEYIEANPANWKADENYPSNR